MMAPNIVILAGGISSRMRKMDSTNEEIDPKLLLEIKEKSKSVLSVGDGCRPFFDYILYNIQKAGYKSVVIVVGEKDASIREYCESKGGSEQFKELHITYAVQEIPHGRNKPLGTADALLVALRSKPEWKGKTFVVCNSDNLYSVRALQMLLEDVHHNAMIDYDRSTLMFDQTRIQAFSVIKKDENGFLLDIIEKPSLREIDTAKDINGRIGVSMNIFKLSFDLIYPLLETIPLHPVRQEKELPTVVKIMINKYPRSLYTIPLAEHVIDLTSSSDLRIVQEYLINEFPSF